MREISDDDKRRQIEALYSRSKRQFPDVPELTVAELDALRRDEEVVLVDVRNPPEQAISMIPGALTAHEFERRGPELDGTTIVTYCTIGHRSGLYARKLRQAGWRAFNLKGAILAWTHAGGELRDGSGPTRRVHVCGRRWSLAANDYEPVW